MHGWIGCFPCGIICWICCGTGNSRCKSGCGTFCSSHRKRSAFCASPYIRRPEAAELTEGWEQAACRCLRSLEILEPDWQALLERWENNPALPAFAPREPEKLERIAVYLAFRYLLKAVNDGDLLGRAQFCLLGVLTVDRLSRFTELSEALRLFSREIEHDQDNLDALLDAFWQVDGLSAAALLAALSK